MRSILFHKGTLLAKMHSSSFPFRTYVQLRHFFKYPKFSPDWFHTHMPFKAICSRTTPQHQVISLMYALLFSNHSPKASRLCQTWEKQLDITFTDEDCERILPAQGLRECDCARNGLQNTFRLVKDTYAASQIPTFNLSTILEMWIRNLIPYYIYGGLVQNCKYSGERYMMI